MPVTPRFRVSQVDDAVVVSIKVPHVRVGGAETYVEGREFSFYCKPYLLRLSFPHDLRNDGDDNCKAVYDPNDDNGTVTVNLLKAVPGQHFPDLDLTTSLMQPRWTPGDLDNGRDGGVSFPSSVEVISSERYNEAFRCNVNEDDAVKGASPLTRAPNGGEEAAEDFKEEQESEILDGSGGLEPEILVRPPHYGFNDRFTGVFAATRDELLEAIQLPGPDKTPPAARRGLRLEHEKAAFNADRYLADSFSEDEDPLLTEALAFEPHWRQKPQRKYPAKGKWCEAVSSNAGDEAAKGKERRGPEHEEQFESFTEGEQEQMSSRHLLGSSFFPGQETLCRTLEKIVGEHRNRALIRHSQNHCGRLPNREYLIPPASLEERKVLLGLADVLFAYAYDHRTTGGEPTVESGWTVAILSSLLSWLETPQGDVNEMTVALSGMRRSLIFPYLRVWPLATLIVSDVSDILAAGKRCILRCLLQTYGILEKGDVYYLLNKLFIEDYCVWIQKVPDASLQVFAERYASATACLNKKGLGLDLEKIEKDALGAAASSSGDGNYSSDSSAECSEDSEEYSEESSDESSDEDSDGSSDEDSDESSDENSEEGSSADRKDGASGKDQNDDTGKIITENIKDGGSSLKDGTMATGTVLAKDLDTSDGRAIASALDCLRLKTKQDNCATSNEDGRSICGPHSDTSRSSELLKLELKSGVGDDNDRASGIADRLSMLRVGKPSGSTKIPSRDSGVEESGCHGDKTLIEEL